MNGPKLKPLGSSGLIGQLKSSYLTRIITDQGELAASFFVAFRLLLNTALMRAESVEPLVDALENCVEPTPDTDQVDAMNR